MTARTSTTGAIRRTAFTLIELLIVISIIALLIAILLPSLKNARKAARMVVCMSNMRQLAVAQSNYANQYKDLIGTFNRTPPAGRSWVAESGYQAQEIVTRITGKTQQLETGRFFHRNYWHLPAVSDGAFGSDPSSLISSVVGCPEDSVILGWKRQALQPNPVYVGMDGDGSSAAYITYRPYWSTYQQVPAAWSYDRNVGTRVTIGQSPQHHLYYGGGTTTASLPLGDRKVSDVAFPSSKVWLFDLYDRHYFKRMIWHAYLEGRQPLVFFDTSVRTYKTSDCRDGIVRPDQAAALTDNINAAGAKTYTYDPTTGWRQYDPPRLNNNGTVFGKYRWTFKGLKGWDYLGANSSTGN